MIETSCGLPGNVLQHKLICEYLNDLYARKNADYGDSFHQTFLEEGWAMPRIRLSDKLNRIKTLSRVEDSKVKDESLRDTLIDLANYAIMSVMELDWMTDEAEEEKTSDASDYGFVTAEQAAENIAKVAAAVSGNKAEKEKPKKDLTLMVGMVVEHTDGSLTCPLCGEEIVCNAYGDMPDHCPACGIKLEYPEVSV